MTNVLTTRLLLTVFLVTSTLSETVAFNDRAFTKFKMYRYQPDESQKIALEAFPPDMAACMAKVVMTNDLKVFVYILTYPSEDGIVGIKVGNSKTSLFDYFSYVSPAIPLVISKTTFDSSDLNNKQLEYIIKIANEGFITDPFGVFMELDKLKDTADNVLKAISKSFNMISDMSTTGFFENVLLDVTPTVLENWFGRIYDDSLGYDDPENLTIAFEESAEVEVYLKMMSQDFYVVYNQLLSGAFATAVARFEAKEQKAVFTPEVLAEKVGLIDSNLKQYYFADLQKKFANDSGFTDAFKTLAEKVQGGDLRSIEFSYSKGELEALVKSGVPASFAVYSYARYKYGESPEVYSSVFGDLLTSVLSFQEAMDGVVVEGHQDVLYTQLSLFTWRSLLVVFTPLLDLKYVTNISKKLHANLTSKGYLIFNTKYKEAFGSADEKWPTYGNFASIQMKNFLVFSRMLTPRMFTYISNFIETLIKPLVDQIYGEFLEDVQVEDEDGKVVFDKTKLAQVLFIYGHYANDNTSEYFAKTIMPLQSKNNRIII